MWHVLFSRDSCKLALWKCHFRQTSNRWYAQQVMTVNRGKFVIQSEILSLFFLTYASSFRKIYPVVKLASSASFFFFFISDITQKKCSQFYYSKGTQVYAITENCSKKKSKKNRQFEKLSLFNTFAVKNNSGELWAYQLKTVKK